MALTGTPFDSKVAYALTKQTAVGLTADTNLRNGAATLYDVKIDNSANAAQAESLKFYDSDGDALVVGTTLPDMVIGVAGAEVIHVMVMEGLPFTSGVSMAGAQQDGTAATGAPTSSMAVVLTMSK